ncbi:MAG: VanZ family protein [Burkholderiaceae bacterium]
MAKPARAAARIPRMPLSAPAHPRESSALTLAIVFTGLVIYASLYPFTGWFWPAGQPLSALIVPPWPRYHIGFDDWSNFLGYMPLGALVYASALRRGRPPAAAGAIACALPSALSWAMEFTQHFLPGRYPSMMDWTLNSMGAAAGLSLAIAIHSAGAGVRWSTLRERWFLPHSGATIALLVLWPIGFLYPSTVPFGQGVSWERLQEAAYDLLNDHPLAPWFDWLWASLGENTGAMSKAAEGFAVALGLLGPCLVAFSISRPGWRRAAVVPVAVLVGLAANTLSAALNFGPVHALGWVTSTVPIGLAFGSAVALAVVFIGQRPAAALGLVALSVNVALVAQAPSDPYYADSLQQWEQGRFIHFHGLAQWVGWLWPFVAGIALFRRLVGSDGARTA